MFARDEERTKWTLPKRKKIKIKMVAPCSKFYHHSPNPLLQFSKLFIYYDKWKIRNAVHCAKDRNKVRSLVVGTSNFIDNFGCWV